MAVNLADKFEDKTSDLLKARRKTEKMVNRDWSWDGVNAINVYTLVDPTMNTYDPTAASNRYGTPSEVQDTVQNWALTRDRSWTKVIDKKNFQDQQMVKKPGKYLAQATKNVLVPEIDAYVLSTIATAANTNGRDTTAASALAVATGVTSGASSSSNGYNNVIALNANVTDNEGAEEGRILGCTAIFYNYLKQGNYVLASDIAQRQRGTGDLGTVDNCEVVIVPSSRMPANVDFIITHPNVTVSPEKLVDYTLHNNAPGYSGALLEYRHRYDAFVDKNQLPQLAVHKTS